MGQNLEKVQLLSTIFLKFKMASTQTFRFNNFHQHLKKHRLCLKHFPTKLTAACQLISDSRETHNAGNIQWDKVFNYIQNQFPPYILAAFIHQNYFLTVFYTWKKLKYDDQFSYTQRNSFRLQIPTNATRFGSLRLSQSLVGVKVTCIISVQIWTKIFRDGNLT